MTHLLNCNGNVHRQNYFKMCVCHVTDHHRHLINPKIGFNCPRRYKLNLLKICMSSVMYKNTLPANYLHAWHLF